jgi:glycosyl transferase family 87
VEGLTAREGRWLLGIGACYAAVVIPIGVHKGGDFVAELSQSERLLHGVPLYAALPGTGIWWPPFTAAALIPFALVSHASMSLTKALWAVLNVSCLGWSLALARRWTSGWVPVAIAVAAVGKPLQSNFEHLNITPILLALVLATAADLRAGRERRAGVWLGLATAIKAFPALMFLYFLCTGRWRGLLLGIAVAGGLTFGAMLPYGPVGGVHAVLDWARLGREAAAFGKPPSQSIPGFATFFGWPPPVIAALALACLGAVVVTIRRSSDAHLDGVAAAALAAVLLSPIAWLYYHTLAMPAWLAAITGPAQGSMPRRATLWLAGLLTSGILTFGLYPQWLAFISVANYTWGSLLLLAVLLVDRLRPPQPEARPI